MGAPRRLTDTWRRKQGFPKENTPKGWPEGPWPRGVEAAVPDRAPAHRVGMWPGGRGSEWKHSRGKSPGRPERSPTGSLRLQVEKC